MFVHGVVGNARSTWTNSDTMAYWPELLLKDAAFADASVYVMEYPTPAIGTSLSVNELAEVMRRDLEAHDVVRHREIVFVSHSMGGLVTRAFLLKYRQYAAQVKMLYFLATPTEGSPASRLAAILSKNPQFGSLYPLQSDSYLGDLQRDWLAAQLPIQSFCAYEGRDTYGMRIVDQRSASSLCTEPLDPILEDHINIAKPASGRAAQFLAVRNAFRLTRNSNPTLPVPGSELDALISYYELQGGIVVATLSAPTLAGPEARSFAAGTASSSTEKILEQFEKLFRQHIAALRRGQLALAAIIAHQANVLLKGYTLARSPGVSYFHLPRPMTPYAPELPAEAEIAEIERALFDPATQELVNPAAQLIIAVCSGPVPLREGCGDAAAAILVAPRTAAWLWLPATSVVCRVAETTSYDALSAMQRVLAGEVDVRRLAAALRAATCMRHFSDDLRPLIDEAMLRLLATEPKSPESVAALLIGLEVLHSIGPSSGHVSILDALSRSADKEIAGSAKQLLARALKQ